MGTEDISFPPVPPQHYGNPKLTADWVIAHAMRGYSAGLCSQSDARFGAWSEYVKAMGLRPQMDAKDFYKIFDRQWETAYSRPSKVQGQEQTPPTPKRKCSTQWVKVTSVDMVWRVNPKDRNDNSVYFTVNRGGKTHTYIAEGSMADYIDGFYHSRQMERTKRRETISGQLNRLAQKVIDELVGKAPAPPPSVPAILTPAPAAASDMASVPVRLGGGGIPPIPGMGAAAAPKPKQAAKPAKKAAAPKPKSKAKNGKTATGITLTAAQKKRLAAKGSITIKRDGKFVTVTR